MLSLLQMVYKKRNILPCFIGAFLIVCFRLKQLISLVICLFIYGLLFAIDLQGLPCETALKHITSLLLLLKLLPRRKTLLIKYRQLNRTNAKVTSFKRMKIKIIIGITIYTLVLFGEMGIYGGVRWQFILFLCRFFQVFSFFLI